MLILLESELGARAVDAWDVTMVTQGRGSACYVRIRGLRDAIEAYGLVSEVMAQVNAARLASPRSVEQRTEPE